MTQYRVDNILVRKRRLDRATGRTGTNLLCIGAVVAGTAWAFFGCDGRSSAPSNAPLAAEERARQTGAGAVAAPTGSAESYARARKALEVSLDALGGLGVVRAAEDVELTVSGHSFARNQSVKVDPPFDRTAEDETLFIDLDRQRYLVENRKPSFGAPPKVLVSDGQAFFIDPQERTIDPVDPVTLATMTFSYIRQVPHLLLAFALEQRAATLRHLGEGTFEGRKHDVVTFATANGLQVALFFDAQTNLLSKHEQMVTDPQDGDALRETIFPSYRAVGPLKIPTGRVTAINGEVIEEVTYTEARLDTRPPESAFAKPKGFEEPPPPRHRRRARPSSPTASTSSRVPSTPWSSSSRITSWWWSPHMSGRGPKATIARTRELFPDKPIRHVVVTHHHFDHAGGVRPYVAEGISVVTTPTNRRYLERMIEGKFTIAADDQKMRPPVFAFVEGGKRVFTDGKQTMEVIDVGPNPHAQEMLIVYLPKTGLVFQGDLLALGADGKYQASTVDDVAMHFFDAINRLGLKVDRIAAVHGPVTSMADLRRAVERKRKANGG